MIEQLKTRDCKFMPGNLFILLFPDRVSRRKGWAQPSSVVPKEVRVLVVNEACFSGTWTDLALELGSKDVMVETATNAG